MDSSTKYEPLCIGLATASEDTSTSNDVTHHSKDISSAFLHPINQKYFKSAQWSPDGTTILTSCASNTLSTYILPPTLLSPPHPHLLTPYTTHPSPERIYASTFHPSYTLSSPSTCLVLASPRCLPIRLISPFAPSLLASYPLVSPTTEAFIAPHSLLFNPADANTFFAGSDSCVSVFDINRNGEGPVTRMRTHYSSRNQGIASPHGMKGIISALAMSNDGILAVGTFTRSVTLYDQHGSGDAIASFSLQNTPNQSEPGGQGITQLLFPPSSTHYLAIAERMNNTISIFDIRSTTTATTLTQQTKPLAFLTGRRAGTQQRLSIDMANEGREVWAGGTDGMVRVWEGIGMREGEVEPSWGFRAHGDVVGSVGVHPMGEVVATCSGQRGGWLRGGEEGGGDEGGQGVDNSLKIWAL